ncbi:hypothetical protein IAT38_003541 [Cryptococcus sp. DSM 104549]
MGNDIEMYSNGKANSTVIEEPADSTFDESRREDGFADPEHDAVFGERREGAIDYRTVGRMKSVVVLMKMTIALGVLAMPNQMLQVGGVPGVIIIIVIALMTTWSGHVVGTFKKNHPEVYSLDGVGFVLAGKWGREIFSAIYALFFCCLAGSGFITLSIAFNSITEHAACTVVWTVIAAVVTCIFASVQTLNKISILGWVGFISIMCAIMTITIAVGVQDRPSTAPPTGPWDKNIHAFNSEASFLNGMSAVSTVVFAYCGVPAFFNVIGEMRQPKYYNQSLYYSQGICSAVYLTIGIVVYYYCGQYLANPALGSAGLLIKKIAYGLALPGLFVGCILYTHVAAKMVFVRALRGSTHLTGHSFIHWAVWLGSIVGCVAVGFILAESIPFFGNFVDLIGATLGTFLAIFIQGWMWLHDNGWGRRSERRTGRYYLSTAMAYWMLASGLFIIIAGTWSAVLSIRDSYADGTVGSAFSCADNSG